MGTLNLKPHTCDSMSASVVSAAALRFACSWAARGARPGSSRPAALKSGAARASMKPSCSACVRLRAVVCVCVCGCVRVNA